MDKWKIYVKWERRVIRVLKIALCLFVAGYIFQFVLFNYVSHTRYYTDFQPYKEEFILIKDYIAEAYPDAENEYLYLDRQEDGCYTLSYFGVKDDPQLPDDVNAALDCVIDNAFRCKDAKLQGIRIKGDHIFFDTESPYCLVYSPEWIPPYYSDSDDGRRYQNMYDNLYHAQWLGGSWYHVVGIA